MEKLNIKSVVALAVCAACVMLTESDALAASFADGTQFGSPTVRYGATDMDPWGWSQQTNQNGARIACESARGRYNTYVAFYNASRSDGERLQWRRELERTKDEIARHCQ